MKTKIKVEDFFREWTGTRPNLKVEFHDAGIEAMAFAEAYHNEETKANEVDKSAITCNLQNVMPSHLFLHTHGDGSDGNEWGLLGIYYKQEDALDAANSYEYDSNVETWDVK